MNLKLSMYPFFADILKREGPREAVRFARDCGFSGVEILEGVRPGFMPLFKNEEQIAELKRLLDENGLTCTCYSVSINILSDELGPDRNLNGVEALKLCADRAEALGSPFLHHTLTIGYNPPADSTDTVTEILPTLLDRAGEVATYCDELGLTTLYEPQGYYVNGLDGFPRFYGEMKRRGYKVGICGDTGNCLYADCDPAAFFARYANEIRHVHIKDIQVENADLNRKNTVSSRRWDASRGGTYLTDTYLGDGSVDLNACLGHLRHVGYTGAYSIETFYWNTLSVSLEDNYKRDVTYALTHFAE